MADSTKEAASAEYRKKRVKRIKHMIIGICVALLILPTILSIFLMIKVFSLEDRIEQLAANQNRMEQQQEDVVQAKLKQKKQETPQTTPEPEQKKVYLTFDDGPGKQTTKILDILKENGVKATFFVTGKEDPEVQKVYKKIVKEGHTIGLHSFSHIYEEIYESKESFQKDLDKIHKLVQKTTGVTPRWYRFPGGSSTESMELPVQTFQDVLEKKNLEYIDWNVISPDISDPSVKKEQMVESIMENIDQFDTSVVLLYDSIDKEMTVKALPLLIKRLKRENYELLPIDSEVPVIQHNN